MKTGEEARGSVHGSWLLAMAAAALGVVGCTDDAGAKAWSSLATCLAGPAAPLPVRERVPKLRQIMLGNPPSTAADAWPKRCATYADDLYAAIDGSGKTAILKHKLSDRLHCTDTKGSCTLADNSALISITTELWESAKDSELELKPPANVKTPTAGPSPVLDVKSWKSFSAKPMRVSGPVLTADGRALVALKTAEGRVRPTVCEFGSDFGKVRCVTGNDKVPELPPQSIEVVNDAKGLYAAGLTEQGLVAYDLETGETSAVGGRAGRLIRAGVVVEKPSTPDITGGPPDPTKPAPKAKKVKGGRPSMFSRPKGAVAAADEGFVAMELKNGKASKGVKLPLTAPVGTPFALGDQIVALTPTANGVELDVKSLTRGRLKNEGTFQGTFAGAFHTCEKGDAYALATYAGHSGQGSAKPTGGDGKTALTFMTFEGGSWSKPAEATMPYDRTGESELVCGAHGASVAWFKGDKSSSTVGRIDCNKDDCKSSTATLPGFDSVYLWAVAPVGDKVLVLYRSSLGDTRLRLAPLAELPNAKDTIVFDEGDYGGPSTGDLSVLATDTAALLLFRSEQPVALRVGPDGSVRVIAS